jgi:hypothetical protein
MRQRLTSGHRQQEAFLSGRGVLSSVNSSICAPGTYLLFWSALFFAFVFLLFSFGHKNHPQLIVDHCFALDAFFFSVPSAFQNMAMMMDQDKKECG